MSVYEHMRIDKEGKLLWINYNKDKEVDIKKFAMEHKNSMVSLEIKEIPQDKTTPQGEYPKFKDDKDCAFSERADCNYGPGYNRCQYMEYGGSAGYWFCKFKKGDK